MSNDKTMQAIYDNMSGNGYVKKSAIGYEPLYLKKTDTMTFRLSKVENLHLAKLGMKLGASNMSETVRRMIPIVEVYLSVNKAVDKAISQKKMPQPMKRKPARSTMPDEVMLGKIGGINLKTK